MQSNLIDALDAQRSKGAQAHVQRDARDLNPAGSDAVRESQA